LSVYMFSKKIIENLYKNGEITKEELLEENDSSLGFKIKKFLGKSLFFFEGTKSEKIQKCQNLEEAIEFAKQFNDDENRIAIVDNFTPMSNSGTGKFLVKRDGKVMPFNEAYPEEAREIDGIMAAPDFVNVYIINLKDLHIREANQRKVKEVFRIEE